MKRIVDFLSILTIQNSLLLRFRLFLISFLFFGSAFSQSVVVSSYFNAADPRDEWIELLVITDNTDMRGWTLADHNATQTTIQGTIQFTNNALWSNLRAGTIIIIWNRVINSASVANTTEINAADGYIELTAQNTTYFTLTSGPGVTFGSASTWAGAALNFAAAGDIIQLLDASGTHVHTLAHRSTAGAAWTALGSPKLNHAASLSSGDAVFVCPGTTVAEYGTSAPQNGTTYTAVSNSALTFGLPNTCTASATANSNYWRLLREPAFSSQTVAASTSPTFPIVAATFTWNAATDPVPADNTVGYMILQNTSNTFGTPTDGTTYATGAVLAGGGTIIAQIDNPGTATVTYSDYTANTSGTYCYRIYAYRYGTDDLNGNTFNVARGRAYNTTDYVTVNCATNPLPVELGDFSAKKTGDQSLLHWTTFSEQASDYFGIYHSTSGFSFSQIGTVTASGTTNFISDYFWTHTQPSKGWNYYRLAETDLNGSLQWFGTVSLYFEEVSELAVVFFQNALSVQTEDSRSYRIEIFSINGSLVSTGSYAGMTTVSLNSLPAGLYFIRVGEETEWSTFKVVIGN